MRKCVSVSLDETIVEAIERQALSEDISRSATVRRAISRYLKEEQITKEKEVSHVDTNKD